MITVSRRKIDFAATVYLRRAGTSSRQDRSKVSNFYILNFFRQFLQQVPITVGILSNNQIFDLSSLSNAHSLHPIG